MPSWRSVTKIAGFGAGSESKSVSQRYGSADPDPYQNVAGSARLQHCFEDGQHVWNEAILKKNRREEENMGEPGPWLRFPCPSMRCTRNISATALPTTSSRSPPLISARSWSRSTLRSALAILFHVPEPIYRDVETRKWFAYTAVGMQLIY